MKEWVASKANAQKKWLENREIIIAAKSKPCVDCRRVYHYSQMDFDHLPGFEKKFDLWSFSVRKPETIRAEIAKCDVVCSNCHRLRTWNRAHPEEIVKGL
jgi:hypothetical protein